MPKTLYVIHPSPPARACRLLCRLLNLDVDIRAIDMGAGEHKQEWFAKLNPRQCVPTLDDEGFIMWESRAIMRYLVTQYGPDGDDSLYPTDPKKRAVVDRVLDFDLGHLYPAVQKYGHAKKFYLKEPTEKEAKDLKRVLTQLNTIPHIMAGRFVTGEKMSIADLSVLTSVTFLESVEFDMCEYEHVEGWVSRSKEAMAFYDDVNEGFHKWIEFGKTEAWRERMMQRMKNEAH